MERDRDNRGRDGDRPCASIVINPAKDECIGSDGIHQREEQFDNLSKIRNGEVSIPMQRILVSWLLCRHFHIFLWTLQILLWAGVEFAVKRI